MHPHCPGRQSAANLDQLKHTTVMLPCMLNPSGWTFHITVWKERTFPFSDWHKMLTCQSRERHGTQGSKQRDQGVAEMKRSPWQKDATETGEAEEEEDYWRMVAEVRKGRMGGWVEGEVAMSDPSFEGFIWPLCNFTMQNRKESLYSSMIHYCSLTRTYVRSKTTFHWETWGRTH